jgi:hypothetical protein
MTPTLEANNQNLNASLVADLASRLRVGNLFSWIEEEAERLACFGTSKNWWTVRFTKTLLDQRGISHVEAASIGSSAHILPIGAGKYKIVYKKGLPDFTRRFAIAHEISHTYWFEPGGNGFPLSPLQKKSGRDPTIEILCNRFAASLLLPRRSVLTAFATEMKRSSAVETRIPLELIPRLSSRFEVAETAIAQRIFFCLDRPISAVLCLRNLESPDPLLVGKVDDKWVTSWCALPSEVSEKGAQPGIRLPLRGRRRIPNSMIPIIGSNRVTELPLDASWWNYIRWTDDESSRKRLENDPGSSQRPAVAFRTTSRSQGRSEERLYLALIGD